ncbi:MAG: ATP-binding protein [Chitinophagaceae bacterium]|jgi:signal transduction histidine kinase|nr:ATP-binding protein [Chitinophagaceae bacterium]
MHSEEKELLTAILTVSIVIGIILLYFIVSIIRQQKKFRQLSLEKIRAEIGTLEKERKRIASDLHDEVGPLLSAVKIQINHLEGQDPEETALIDKSNRYIDDIIRRMREISNNLLPNTLVRKGLKAAIAEFISKMPAQGKPSIEFRCSGDRRLPEVQEVNVYRLVQEIVHNSVKHSQADRLLIELEIGADQLKLATADNGVGFDYDEIAKRGGGLGLLNLQSRTDVMGGSFSFESGKGKGTKYLFEIPLATQNTKSHDKSADSR